ncbi:hypothetical protein VZT92_023806 [Zoarces viviparus]|uniref:Uncharacterized protein n=1 Tax=Zoarces viviparus TaxID=48416 RepID=A0AAW1E873_ZOAVI
MCTLLQPHSTAALPEREALSCGWLSVTLGLNERLLCLHNSPFCILMNHRAIACLLPVFRLRWSTPAGQTGLEPATESPPASSSTSSERQQHPHIAPTDDVKVSAESCFTALSLCRGLFEVFVLCPCEEEEEEEGRVKALY